MITNFTGPVYDGLHFVRRQVLGFIDDHEHLNEAPAAGIGERLDMHRSNLHNLATRLGIRNKK